MTDTSAKPKSGAPKPPRYQRRIVLFLDFLGFKEHVDRSAREPEFLARLLRAMDRVGAIAADNQSVSKSQKVSQFSDCIVVSFKAKEPSAVFRLLNAIAFCVVDLAEMGFLVRGGVTVGKLHHSKRHVVGPAMNEAHRLESRVAQSPRVLIDPALLEVARRYRQEHHSPHEEASYVADFMTRDADGQHYFDYVSWRSVIAGVGGSEDYYGDYLAKLAALLRDGLRHDDPRVQEKYLWLHHRYRAEVERYQALPDDDAYRLANGALCAQIASLPLFKADSKLAEKAVKAAAKTSPPKPKNRRKR